MCLNKVSREAGSANALIHTTNLDLIPIGINLQKTDYSMPKKTLTNSCKNSYKGFLADLSAFFAKNRNKLPQHLFFLILYPGSSGTLYAKNWKFFTNNFGGKDVFRILFKNTDFKGFLAKLPSKSSHLAQNLDKLYKLFSWFRFIDLLGSCMQKIRIFHD